MCIYIYIYLHTYIHVYIYIYIHTHTHTHTHISIYPGSTSTRKLYFKVRVGVYPALRCNKWKEGRSQMTKKKTPKTRVNPNQRTKDHSASCPLRA